MKRLLVATIVTLASVMATAQTPPPPPAGAMTANHPCAVKHQAKHAAHEALHLCLEGWNKDENLGAAFPTEDCSNKLVVFIQAAKDAKACHQAQHGAKTN